MNFDYSPKVDQLRERLMRELKTNVSIHIEDSDKAGVFNKACGSIGFPKDKCDQLVAAKSPKDAFAILGNQAEKWCVALRDSKTEKVTCDMVLPKVFPPING